MPNAFELLQSLINGLGVGLVYGLIAIGFCVIYNASGIVNFAQGVFVMLGGMFAHTLLTRLGLPMLAAALISIVLVAMVGVLVQVLVINPMWQRKAPLFAIILATLAVQLLIEQVVILTLGDQPRTYPEFTLGGPLKIGPIAIGYQLFWILGCGALMVVALQLFFNRTRVGRALRACSQNREAAALLGIPVASMLMLSFALSAALGAAAGILITPTQYTAYSVDGPFGINGFIAAIIGGFGSAPAALVGGTLLGVVQAGAIVFFGAGYKNVVALTILLIVLLFFPKGLFGGWGKRVLRKGPMHALIVYANPEPTSFTAALKDTAVDALRGAGHTVEVSDLYAEGFDPVAGRHDFVEAFDPNRFHYQTEQGHAHATHGFAPEIAREQQRFLKADLVIWVYPIWWGGVPAILKGWFDRVLAYGFAYSDGRRYDTGFFPDKRGILCLTTGGTRQRFSPTDVYGSIDQVLWPVQRLMLEYLAIRALEPFVAYGTPRVDQQTREGYLHAWRTRLLDIAKDERLAAE